VKVHDDAPAAPQNKNGEHSHNESVLSRPSTAEVSVTSIETEVASATANASDSEPESQPRVHSDDNEFNAEDDEHEDEAIQHGNK